MISEERKEERKERKEERNKDNRTFSILNREIKDLDALEKEIPEGVTVIVLYNASIQSIPRDFFTRFVFLESIELSKNCLTEITFTIPFTVSHIDLSHNLLDRGAIKTCVPNTVETVIMTGNPYHNFLQLENVGETIYGNTTQVGKWKNPQRLYSPIRTAPRGFSKKIQKRSVAELKEHNENNENKEPKEQKENNENNESKEPQEPQEPEQEMKEESVELKEETEGEGCEEIEESEEPVREPDIVGVHQTQLQDNLKKSITYLLSKEPSKDYLEEMPLRYKEYKEYNQKNSGIFSRFIGLFSTEGSDSDSDSVENFERLLTLYNSFANDIIYDYDKELMTNIPRLLESFWTIAKNSEYCHDILESLYYQMIDGENLCFIGKYARIINSLTSYDNKVFVVGESISELLERRITILDKDMKQGYTFKLALEELVKYMDSMDLIQQDREPWIQAFKDAYEPIEEEYEKVDDSTAIDNDV
jgi:hypothetical protein